MDTQQTIRARELQELYNNFHLPAVSREQRLDVLMTIKHTVRVPHTHRCSTTNITLPRISTSLRQTWSLPVEKLFVPSREKLTMRGWHKLLQHRLWAQMNKRKFIGLDDWLHEFFPIFIQEQCFSVWEQDLLISRSDFVMFSLKALHLHLNTPCLCSYCALTLSFVPLVL